MIRNDAASKNLPTVDQAFSSSDGIPEPDAADTSPGHDRLATAKERSTIVTQDGAVQIAHLIGATVYSSTGENLGTVRDVLLRRVGEPQAIIMVDGKLVAVPWSKLLFDVPGSDLHGRPVLAGETRHALKELPRFNFTAEHQIPPG